MRECRLAWSPGEARIAVCDDETLIDFALWRPGMSDGYGDHHAVRVQKSAAALGGAFVTLAGGGTGFLTGTHQEGALVAARVTRSAQNGKGLRLKPHGVLPQACEAPQVLRRGPTPLETLAARYPDAPILCDAPALMALLPVALRSRLERVGQAFDSVLDARCDDLMAAHTPLPHGLCATITPTPALTAIDLDDPNPDQRRQMDGFTANRQAFSALAAEIQMRNLSGAILIDPAGVAMRKRPALVPFLAKALEGDPQQAKALGATALGLLEVVRTRGRPALHEMTSSPGGHALAALRTILREKEGRGKTGKPQLRASVGVVRALEEDRDALAGFALEWGASLSLVMDPDYPDRVWSFTA
ncbi:ribonuclease E/G [Asaia krungthepensis]|nr:ribonuclease E/G [Asaia krungthepensis]